MEVSYISNLIERTALEHFTTFGKKGDEDYAKTGLHGPEPFMTEFQALPHISSNVVVLYRSSISAVIGPEPLHDAPPLTAHGLSKWSPCQALNLPQRFKEMFPVGAKSTMLSQFDTVYFGGLPAK